MNRIAAVSVVVLLAGCAGVPEPPTLPGDWQRRADRLAALDQWNLRGRIAVKTDVDAFNGTLVWTQADDFLSLTFRAPLGVGGFHLVGDRRGLTLQMSNGEEWQLTDPERELQERIGWSVPLDDLRFWILAVPAEGESELEYDDAGRLQRLYQDGWQVSYSAYKQVQDEWMPHRFVVEAAGIRLRLAVDRWRLTAATADERQ